MSNTPTVTVLTQRGGRRRPHLRLHVAPPPTPVTSSTLAFDGVESVEIVAPDRYCAMLLLDHAAQAFPARLVPGPGWIVRFEAPQGGGEWVVDLLALVERWLASAPIPCAKLRRGGHSYLVRGPLDAA